MDQLTEENDKEKQFWKDLTVGISRKKRASIEAQEALQSI